MGTPRFFGRSEELQQIVHFWRKASEGQPQVVNLVADTGVGKTRLVHEFYRWLSSNSEQSCRDGKQSYWPSDLGIGRQRVVNPSFDQFGPFDLKESRIPWLWWGLYWTDSDGENICALMRFHNILETHLKMLELERRCRLSNWETLSDVAKDETLDFISDLIPGGGQVKNVAKLAKKLHASLQERKRAQKGIAEGYENQQKAIVDDIISRLQVAFNPKYKEVPRVPLVVFLDDVHFATDISDDGFSLQFLDRLLRRAVREQWPLLVITTHWKGPWQAHLSYGDLKQGKPWRRLMLEFDAEQNSNALGIHHLELSNIPYEELRAVALDLLPGLSPGDQKSLLARVDNVRWLVEVLHALSDNVENFEGNERSHPLSRYGHRRLEELLKTRGYLEVIRQRLEDDALQDVRNVLGAAAWHAHELEFLSPLARAFGEELVKEGALVASNSEPGQRVLDVLLRALNPAALLEGRVEDDHTLPSLVKFPERGYLEIARELFDLERLPNLRLALGREIISWMQSQDRDPPRWQQLADNKEKKAFLEIALEVLEKLQPQLSEEQQHELAVTEKTLRRQMERGKLTEKELKEDLEEAKNKLFEESEIPQLFEAEKWQAITMAELTRILYEEGSCRAWELAFLVANHAELPATKEAISFWTKIHLANIWKEKRNYCKPARQLINDLITAQATSLDAETAPARLHDIAIALELLAEMDQEEGALEEAQVSIQLCLAIREHLRAKYGATPEQLRASTFSLMRLVDMDQVEGTIEAARVSAQRWLAVAEQLLAEYGETPGRLKDLAIALDCLAYLDQAEDATEAARIGFQRSLVIREQLLAEYGAAPGLLRELAVVLMHLADLDKVERAIEPAGAGYQHSLAIREQLLAEYGETPVRLRDIAIVLERLADLDRAKGAGEAARAGYQRCLEIHKQLIDKYGWTRGRMNDMRPAQMSLADLSQAEDATAGVSTYPPILPTDMIVDQLGNHLAYMDKAAGGIEAARVGFQRWLAISEQLLVEHGESSVHLKNLALSLIRLADLDQAMEAVEAARVSALRWLAVAEQLLAEYGGTSARHRDLVVASGQLADLDRAKGAIEAARAGFKSSLTVSEQLLAEHGAPPERLRELARPLEQLAYLDQATGTIEATRIDFLRSVRSPSYSQILSTAAQPATLSD